MTPTWLPNLLTFSSADVREDYRRLHDVFQNDLLDGELTIDGCNVVVDTSRDSEMPHYERGFIHMITKDDGNGFRAIDYARAAKLVWVKPVIENYTAPEVYSFEYQNPTDVSLHLWLFDHDFVVVLKQMRSAAHSDKIIVTAYHVEPSSRRGLQSKYGRASRVL